MEMINGFVRAGMVLVLVVVASSVGFPGGEKYAIAKADQVAANLQSQIDSLTAQREALVLSHKKLGEQQREAEIQFWKVTGALTELQKLQASDSKKKK